MRNVLSDEIVGAAFAGVQAGRQRVEPLVVWRLVVRWWWLEERELMDSYVRIVEEGFDGAWVGSA